MRSKHLGIYYSLLAALISMPDDAFAGIRISNQSRNKYANEMAYQAQQAEIAAQAAAAATAVPTELPVRVADKNVADKLLAGQTDVPVTMEQLDKCAMVYPTGEFEWARPTVGSKIAGPATCVSVIEMRSVDKIDKETQQEAVLARAYLAAGDNIRCNISEWAESTWLPAAETVEFPADQAPTMQDVVKAMNEEQKQSAGIKIAAGAVVGALAGNVVGKSAPGSDSIIGTNDEKVKSSVIGALAGAGVMAGNAYGGKVAGDAILSAGVNAAAGGVMGNMVASGDSVMRIEKCSISEGGDEDAPVTETTCLWGVVEMTKSLDDGAKIFVNYKNPNNFLICENKDTSKNATTDTENTSESEKTTEKTTEETSEETTETGSSDDKITYTFCKSVALTNAKIEGFDYAAKGKEDKTLSDIYDSGKWTDVDLKENGFCVNKDKSDMVESCTLDPEKDNQYILLESGDLVESREPAMIVGVRDTTFGYKSSDWGKLKGTLGGKPIVKRSGVAGTAGDVVEGATLDNFRPSYLSADSGGVIDLDNKARLKSTMIGAGAGGALGAFTAYQGAQTDIENRWTAEVRNYNDSLRKIYCITGKRFLVYYNEIIDIPEMKE